MLRRLTRHESGQAERARARARPGLANPGSREPRVLALGARLNVRGVLGFGPTELPRSLAAALRDVDSPKPHVRRSAARQLGMHVSSDARERVVRRLCAAAVTDADTEVRVQAILALADGEANESVGSLASLALNGSPKVRQMALLALAELAEPGEPQVLQAAQHAIDSALPALRYQGLVALRHVAQLEAVPALSRGLADADAEVRWVSLRLLEELTGESRAESPPPWALELRPRLRALQRDVQPRVAMAAHLLLASWGDRNALRSVATLFAERSIADQEDELTAVRLLGRWQVAEARPALEKRAWPFLFEGPIAFEARVALAALGDERSRQSLVSDLYSRVTSRCARAIEPVGRLHLVEGRARLAELLDDPEGLDAEAIRSALERLTR